MSHFDWYFAKRQNSVCDENLLMLSLWRYRYRFLYWEGDGDTGIVSGIGGLVAIPVSLFVLGVVFFTELRSTIGNYVVTAFG